MAGATTTRVSAVIFSTFRRFSLTPSLVQLTLLTIHRTITLSSVVTTAETVVATRASRMVAGRAQIMATYAK